MAPSSRLAFLGALLLASALAGCAPKRAEVRAQPSVPPPPVQANRAPPVARALPVSAPYRPLDLASLAQRVPVLTYHGVIGSRSQRGAVWFDCTAAEFEAQMQFLRAQGAHVITLDQLRRHLTLGEPLPDRAIALTFDDSYQGVYDYAAPILKRYGYPYAVFVHTDYVGSQQGRPKMSWTELRELAGSGLVTIGSHSRSHPADMGRLSTEQQDEELQGSKQALEQALGRPISFVSYPNGKADAVTFGRARAAGYTLGFMEEWGPVQQSPGILALNRYIHLQLPRAWAENYGWVPTAPEVGNPVPSALGVLPAGVVQTLGTTALKTGQTVAAGVPLILSRGGTLSAARPGRVLSPQDFVPAGDTDLTLYITSRAAPGASVGPSLAGGAFVPEPDPARLTLLTGRPLVAWNAGRVALLPFVPGLMNDDAGLNALLPGLSGAFVAGGWLVQRGQAMSRQDILTTGTSDLRRLRRRVFFGVTAAGEPLLGVSRSPVSARQLALAAAALGAQDAVLVY